MGLAVPQAPLGLDFDLPLAQFLLEGCGCHARFPP